MPILPTLHDLLPLRDPAGRPCGLFSDHGSWLGVCWGERGTLLEVYDTSRTPAEVVFSIGMPRQVVRRTTCPDRLEAELEDGGVLRIGFQERDLLFLSCPDDLPLRIERSEDGPEHRRVPGGWLLGLRPGGPVSPDLFDQNRDRWERWLERACRALPDGLADADRRLYLRAAVTLAWNRRGPLGNLQHGGVVPTPFGYPGYWSNESWIAAHALAKVDPGLAVEQLRVQFEHQADDGMVPDTVRPDPDDDNWSNSKPARAAWALEAIVRASGDSLLIDELLEKCSTQMFWWQAQRSHGDEELFRPGGVDRETAMWDTGWDQSVRFDGVRMSKRPPWKLLDLWPIDVNSVHLLELRAMQRLAGEKDCEHGEAARIRADRLVKALLERWDAELGMFVDGASGEPDAEWRPRRTLASAYPLWAGIGGDAERAALCTQLLDPQRFATPMPFPCLARDDADFDPVGFWNGSVFPEHAVVALQVLGDQGAELRARFVETLSRWPSLYECYDPLDAEPVRGSRPAYAQSSATAAAVVELMTGGPLAAIE